MDIQDIEIFARVAAVQNLSAVGVELGLTPGTISKRLQALEDELSVRLFERTTRSIRITEEGSRFLGHVETILSELQQARAAVADVAGKPKGRLRVSASHALGRTHIAPAILTFVQEFPEIDVHVDLTDHAVNLQEAGYDVAIYSGTLGDSALIAKRLAFDRFMLVAAPSYVKARDMPQSASDLASHHCLAIGDRWAWAALDDGKEINVRIQSRIKSDNSDFLRLAALNGHGIFRTTELHVRDDIRAGHLVPVLEQCEWGSNAGVWALYPPTRHILPRLRVFLDFLASWFRADANGTLRDASVSTR